MAVKAGARRIGQPGRGGATLGARGRVCTTVWCLSRPEEGLVRQEGRVEDAGHGVVDFDAVEAAEQRGEGRFHETVAQLRLAQFQFCDFGADFGEFVGRGQAVHLDSPFGSYGYGRDRLTKPWRATGAAGAARL